MVENYLKIGDHKNAVSWVEKLGEYLKSKEVLGDWEFLKGKLYFEAGEPGKALLNFQTAFGKTKGHCFEEQDPKYLDFYRNPDKNFKSK